MKDSLQHHGVKGMKWGVRKSADRVAKSDAKWAKKVMRRKNFLKVEMAMREELNVGGLDKKIRSNPKYSDEKLRRDPALYREFLSEYAKMATGILNKYSDRFIGTSKSGNLKVKFNYNYPSDIRPTWEVVDTRVKHSIEELDDSLNH